MGSQSIAVRLLLREAPSRAAAGTGEAGSWFMGSTAKAAGRIRGVELRKESGELMKFSHFMVRLYESIFCGRRVGQVAGN